MLPIRQRAGILIRNRAYSKNHAVLSRGLSRSTVLGLRRKISSVAVPNLLSFLRLKSSKVISVNKYIHNDYLPQSGHPSVIWDLLHSPLITFLSWLKNALVARILCSQSSPIWFSPCRSCFTMLSLLLWRKRSVLSVSYTVRQSSWNSLQLSPLKAKNPDKTLLGGVVLGHQLCKVFGTIDSQFGRTREHFLDQLQQRIAD